MSDESKSNIESAIETTLEQQCADYLAGWQRAQADYANLKRESERERVESSKFANTKLLERLLPAIDQFETALSFTPDLTVLDATVQPKFQNWNQGLQAVKSSWEAAFREIGLTRVPTEGLFNPQIHEAVGADAREGVPPGHILQVVQSGWMLHDRLLRPARVIIAA